MQMGGQTVKNLATPAACGRSKACLTTRILLAGWGGTIVREVREHDEHEHNRRLDFDSEQVLPHSTEATGWCHSLVALSLTLAIERTLQLLVPDGGGATLQIRTPA